MGHENRAVRVGAALFFWKDSNPRLSLCLDWKNEPYKTFFKNFFIIIAENLFWVVLFYRGEVSMKKESIDLYKELYLEHN